MFLPLKITNNPINPLKIGIVICPKKKNYDVDLDKTTFNTFITKVLIPIFSIIKYTG